MNKVKILLTFLMLQKLGAYFLFQTIFQLVKCYKPYLHTIYHTTRLEEHTFYSIQPFYTYVLFFLSEFKGFGSVSGKIEIEIKINHEGEVNSHASESLHHCHQDLVRITAETHFSPTRVISRLFFL